MQSNADTPRAWSAAHRITVWWLAAVVGAWVALWIFSAVTIPLKYPYEAHGQIIDSGVVVGLVIPLAVMSVVLDEGPAHMVACASRRLAKPRLILAGMFNLTALAFAGLMSWVAAVPTSLLLVDALFLAALTVLGVGLFGARMGWMLPAVVAFTMSAPGLVPWQLNVLYHRDVGAEFVLATVATVAVSAVAMARLGSRGIAGGRGLRNQTILLAD